MFTYTKKQIITGIIVSILLIALPVLLYLVSQRQIFKPKAIGENSQIEFRSTSGQTLPEVGGIPQTTVKDVKLRIIYSP
jgi:hypothetical protein